MAQSTSPEDLGRASSGATAALAVRWPRPWRADELLPQSRAEGSIEAKLQPNSTSVSTSDGTTRELMGIMTEPMS